MKALLCPRYSTTAAYTTAHVRNITAAAVQNRAGAFVLPSQVAFPFTPDEMPRSIGSRDWNKLDLNMSVRADKYPCGGLIFMIANADLSTLGACLTRLPHALTRASVHSPACARSCSPECTMLL